MTINNDEALELLAAIQAIEQQADAARWLASRARLPYPSASPRERIAAACGLSLGRLNALIHGEEPSDDEGADRLARYVARHARLMRKAS